MKPIASYSRRFKLNFEPKKKFSEKFTPVLPLKSTKILFILPNLFFSVFRIILHTHFHLYSFLDMTNCNFDLFDTLDREKISVSLMLAYLYRNKNIKKYQCTLQTTLILTSR